jgi:hypothetical protein
MCKCWLLRELFLSNVLDAYPALLGQVPVTFQRLGTLITPGGQRHQAEWLCKWTNLTRAAPQNSDLFLF